VYQFIIIISICSSTGKFSPRGRVTKMPFTLVANQQAGHPPPAPFPRHHNHTATKLVGDGQSQVNLIRQLRNCICGLHSHITLHPMDLSSHNLADTFLSIDLLLGSLADLSTRTCLRRLVKHYNHLEWISPKLNHCTYCISTLQPPRSCGTLLLS